MKNLIEKNLRYDIFLLNQHDEKATRTKNTPNTNRGKGDSLCHMTL
jgi:hypothetical protein